MRKIIIILILFLIGFSHPLLSKNLPTSLFGITLLDNVDKYLKNKEDNEPNIIDIQDMNFYYYYEDTINFTENLDFSEYFITTSKDGIINGIGASKKTNSCQDEQDKLIDVYSTLYDIKKEDFDNIFLRGLFNDKYIMYIDRDFIVYGNNSNLVLSFECEITAFEYTFYISLSTSDTFKSWDHALDVKEVPTINSDFLNRYDNLSGFGINEFPDSLFGFKILDPIEKYLDPENLSTSFSIFLDEYPSYKINNRNYQKTKMIYNDSFENYLILLNNEKKILGINAYFKDFEINFDNFENDECKLNKNYFLNMLSDLYLTARLWFVDEYYIKKNSKVTYISDSSFYHDSLNENVLLIECIYANEKSILSIGLLNKNHFDELNNKLVVKKIDDIDLKLLKTDISGF